MRIMESLITWIRELLTGLKVAVEVLPGLQMHPSRNSCIFSESGIHSYTR